MTEQAYTFPDELEEDTGADVELDQYRQSRTGTVRFCKYKSSG